MLSHTAGVTVEGLDLDRGLQSDVEMRLDLVLQSDVEMHLDRGLQSDVKMHLDPGLQSNVEMHLDPGLQSGLGIHLGHQQTGNGVGPSLAATLLGFHAKEWRPSLLLCVRRCDKQSAFCGAAFCVICNNSLNTAANFVYVHTECVLGDNFVQFSSAI